MTKRYAVVLSFTCLLGVTVPSLAKNDSIAAVTANAVQKSALTVEGGPAFHLKAQISEPGQADSDYVGTVDLTWISPTKWKRVIESPEFAETAVYDGERHFVETKGDYFPLWFRNLVSGLTDPLPMASQLEKINGQLTVGGGTSCVRFQTRVGVAPVQNSVFSAFCFNGDGLVASITSPGYSVSYRNYKPFAGKRVARLVDEYLEPGVNVQAQITELSELRVVPDISIPGESGGVEPNRIRIEEAAARGLAKNAPAMAWPMVRDGKTSGTLSIYISVDENGHVRETYPLNSDNPQLDDAAREQVSRWEFRPAAPAGASVQIEAILTFAFSTAVANPPAVLTDSEARKLATNAPDPIFPPGAAHGTRIDVRVTVGADGTVRGLENTKQQDWKLIGPINLALHNWRFQPLMRDGRPDAFKADLVFVVP